MLLQGGDPSDSRQIGDQATLAAAIGAAASDVFMGAALDALEFTRRAEASNLGPHTLEPWSW